MVEKFVVEHKRMVKKILLGSILLLVILSTSFYIMLPNKIRIDFQKTRTIFSVYDNSTNKFVTSGIESTRIFDGAKLMRAKNRSISYELYDGTTRWYRLANFKEGIIVEDFVSFDNDAIDVENVPVSHQACFTNAAGKIFEYLISNIEYDGETKDIISPFAALSNRVRMVILLRSDISVPPVDKVYYRYFL